jgi:hypothetical protein
VTESIFSACRESRTEIILVILPAGHNPRVPCFLCTSRQPQLFFGTLDKTHLLLQIHINAQVPSFKNTKGAGLHLH